MKSLKAQISAAKSQLQAAQSGDDGNGNDNDKSDNAGDAFRGKGTKRVTKSEGVGTK